MPSAKLVRIDRRAAGFISRAGTDHGRQKTVVNMRLDTDLLRLIDAAAKRQGITRTAWLSVTAARMLDE